LTSFARIDRSRGGLIILDDLYYVVPAEGDADEEFRSKGINDNTHAIRSQKREERSVEICNALSTPTVLDEWPWSRECENCDTGVDN
jgi:hypothetical protein